VIDCGGIFFAKIWFYTISFSFFMDVNIYNKVNSVLGVELGNLRSL